MGVNRFQGLELFVEASNKKGLFVGYIGLYRAIWGYIAVCLGLRDYFRVCTIILWGYLNPKP